MISCIKSTLKIILVILICFSLLRSINSTVHAYTDESWILPETISSGFAHTCGIRGDGTLTCWGRNNLGQLLSQRNFMPIMLK